MRLPRLYGRPAKEMRTVSTFHGLNQRIVTAESEFAQMKNMSCRHYPVIATREPRGEVLQTYDSPQGLFWKNGLFVVNGGKCYYEGTDIGISVSEGKKQIVGMGAYIVVFPDKYIYNTFTGEVKPMEAAYTPTETVTFEPLSQSSTFTKITAAGIGGLFLAYDNVTISGCYDDQFNGSKIITEIDTDYIVVSGVLTDSFTQEPSSGIKFTRKIPDMDFICESENRLWGCSSKNHEIYASKPGDPTNWNNFEGIDSDSYVVTVGSDGDFTGCIAHLGYVLFFKENYIHTMYGNRPSNFSLYTKEQPGVRAGCDKSLTILNDVLYYVGRDGVYAYSGTMPAKISDNILSKITDAVGGKYDGRYYLSCKLDGEQTILVYDQQAQIWDAEDDDTFVFTANVGGVLEYIDPEGNLRAITGDSGERIEWELVSGDLMEGILDYKYIAQFLLNIWLSDGAYAQIHVKYDDNELWELLETIQCTEHRSYDVPMLPKRCSKFRYRISGQGEMKLIGLQETVEGGSSLNGSVQSGLRRQHQQH